MAAPAAAAPVALLADPALHTRIQGSVRLMLCSSPGHSDALARVVQNHTFSATESAWKVTHPAEGYQQGTAEFDNALPEAHTFLKQVWYSNHPQAFAIFMPPVTNGVSCAPQTCSAAVTLTTSYPQSRPCTLPARQSRTEGLSPFLPCSIQLRARSPSATLSQHILQPFTGFHVLYGVEALDPTTPIQLTVLKGPGSDAYVVVQGAIVTAYTPPIPGTDVYVDEDATADLLYAVPGIENAVTALSSGRTPPYSTATAATASATTPTGELGSTASPASDSSGAGIVVSSASGVSSSQQRGALLRFGSAIVFAVRGRGMPEQSARV